jgi:M6 family metalloprotease-like protein
MKTKSASIYILFVLLTISLKLVAVPATPFPIIITQPNGSQITIHLHGDEYFNYKTTLDGYALVADNEGYLTYAKVNAEGKLVSTSVRANEIQKRNSEETKLIQTLKPNSDFSKSNLINRLKRSKAMITGLAPQKSYPLTGTPKSLVILVNFRDKSFVTPNPQAAFSDLLNQNNYSTNGGTGCAKDYFHDSSNGTFNPQFDVVGPVTLNNDMAYYGANDANGNDIAPAQMVVDACSKAAASGVDFSQYDTDKDGVVDNIFIYYAGYNEAEGGPASSIWPHRWAIYPTALYSNGNYSGTVASTTFNGVTILDYACTSELKGNSGSNMCGIGTFCHEFGHVLGLDDYYVTSGTDHHTLSVWNIMDYGAYLNSGRTPPTYCAYDRYFLKWLNPIQLNVADDYSLDYLGTSNKAYLISQTANRDKDIANDSNSPEYFLLENRQKTNWDKYLPGHGMIVYHIYYNATTWANNAPNNDPNAMGVDIVEADGMALTETASLDPTLPGDPFPGTSNITTYNPTLRNGTNTKKPLVKIQENNGIIQFHFSSSIVMIQNIHSFTTVQGTPSVIQTATISGSKLKGPVSVSFKYGQHYEMKKDTDPSNAWTKTIILTPIDSLIADTNIQIRYNPTVPSYNDIHYDTFIATTTFGDDSEIPISGTSTRPVYVVPPLANQANQTTFTGFIANWNIVPDTTGIYLPGKYATGYYVSVYTITNGQTNYIQKDTLIHSNVDTLKNLIPGTNYFYNVKATDKTIYYENITDFSNTISVTTLPYPFKTRILATVDSNGDITVYLPTTKTTLYVYNLLGETIRTIIPKNSTFKLSDLPKHQIYILKADNLITKIVN